MNFCLIEAATPQPSAPKLSGPEDKVGSCAQVAKPELDGFMACVNDHLKWSI